MIRLSPDRDSPPLRRPWKNGIAVGRAYDLLRADLREHLAWLQREIGFRSCRCHGLFHDDMAVVRRRRDGVLVYQWHLVDQVYDHLLRLGLRPLVELNPMPAALASGSQTMFHYAMNVSPPRRWEDWSDLVGAFARHCLERYGPAEVRQWRFEVWNEPNLPAFWAGTKEEYFQLYAHAARALKQVDPALLVGGPATSKAHWLRDLVDHCQTGGIPLDFLSTHLYPQDEFVCFPDRASSPHPPGAFFCATVRAAAAEVASSPRPDLPLLWTEWNSQQATSAADVTWGENRYVDSLEAASFVVRHMVELDDAAESLVWWVASDLFEESPQPLAPFSRTYGLLTVHGLPKASANAFRLLERLRGPRLILEHSLSPPFGCGAVATREGEAIQAILWHDRPPECPPNPPWRESLRLELPRGAGSSDPWVVTQTLIRAGAGSAWETWETMGRPLNLSSAQQALLRSHAEPATSATLVWPRHRALEVPLALAANQVLHLEFRPRGPVAAPKSEDLTPEQSLRLEAQLGAVSRA